MIDPRPLTEILRQWSTINPEFLFLPRKFKIAICSAEQDRATIMMHDIGLYLYPGDDGQMLLRVIVGGGLGRTPILGLQIREGLPWQHLLSYVEAVLRVYNRHGRRDNKYKARIKIPVKAVGIEAFARETALWRTPTSISAHACPKTRPSPVGCRATSSRTKCRATPAWCCRPNRALPHRRVMQ